MNNYKIYTERLAKGLDEKLFFLNELKNDVDFNNCVFIDFGCANGVISNYLAKQFSDSTIIYIDKDETLLNEAREINSKINRNGKSIFANSIGDKDIVDTLQVTNKTKLFICSSVLHEVDLIDQFKILDFAHTYCDYLIVRDMRFECFESSKNIDSMMYSIKNSKYKNMCKDLENNYPFKVINLAEFLLKYEYIENWETEKKEKYFYTNWNCIETFFTPIYIRDYTLPYKKQKIKEDFGFDIHFFTHRQAIYKPQNKTTNQNYTERITRLI